MLQNKINQTIKLKDGRALGFAEFGDPQGKPIFEFHGNPSSRLGSDLFDESAKKMGIHVIGIDRPGMSLSDSGEGHFSLLPNHAQEILETLVK